MDQIDMNSSSIKCEKDKMNLVYQKVKQLTTIVNELESEFLFQIYRLIGNLPSAEQKKY